MYRIISENMKRIGLLSDTHAYWDERYIKYFSECDEIWHAGDIGSMEIVDKFQSFNHSVRFTVILTDKIYGLYIRNIFVLP